MNTRHPIAVYTFEGSCKKTIMVCFQRQKREGLLITSNVLTRVVLFSVKVVERYVRVGAVNNQPVPKPIQQEYLNKMFLCLT